MAHLDLWKFLLKQKGFELGYELKESGEIPQTGRQQIPDRWSNETEKTVINRSDTAFLIFKSLSLEDQRVREV